jgi:hypothetical protein
MTTTTNNVWWGTFTAAEEESLLWEIGEMRLSILRRAQEWQVTQTGCDFTETEDVASRMASGGLIAGDIAKPERFIFTKTGATLRVMPQLADRPVIVRPADALHVLAGQETTLFVSSPLWMHIEVHDSAVTLGDFPIQRPSDTWFGPSTLVGELCYASSTQGRLRLDELPPRPHRAVTPVSIVNHSAEPLLLERLSLPVPFLSLYASERGILWTNGVTMRRSNDTDLAEITVSEAPPPTEYATHRLTGPRKKAEKNMLMRAFGALLGYGDN